MKNFFPILVVPSVPYNNGIRFLHRDEQIDIGEDLAKDIWKILEYCNGRNSIQEIAEKSELDKDLVFQIISELTELEIILDSREQYKHFHKISSYPTNFNRVYSTEEVADYTKSKPLPCKSGIPISYEENIKSNLLQLTNKRRSCRSFSNKKLTLNQIGNICRVAYSINHGSVPSGGALYPLKIYVIVAKDQEDLKKGYYEYDSINDKLVLFDFTVDEEKLKYCYNSETLPFNSSVQFIIAADLERQTYKYANRGYRLTLIEVGHVAENICLYCAENGLETCELGGILDNAMQAELSLETKINPILAIAVGYEADTKLDDTNYLDFAEKTFVGKEVNDYSVQTFGENCSFFGATAIYGDTDNPEYAGATSSSYQMAAFKSIIEGYERYRSGQIKVDYFGKANDLPEDFILPEELTPLTEEQIEKMGFLKYDPTETQIRWTKGIRYKNNKTVYLPTDIMYYGFSEKDRIYFGNSSGIAAHFSEKMAIKNGLAEIIERDAIMKSWYEHIIPNKLDDSILPVHILKRKQYWKVQNRELYVLDLKSEYAPSILVVIKSEEEPCFICGAATTLDNNINTAINKALNEAEYKLYLALKYPENINIKAEEVKTPAEHGQFYYKKENADKLQWLLQGKTIEKLPVCQYNVDELLDKIDAIIIDMSDSNSKIKVMRVVSTKLVPINFGFNSAHYAHSEIRNLNQETLKLPHYFD